MKETYLGDGRGRPPRDMANQVYGHLTVLRIVGKTNSGSLRWHCKCSCGNFVVVDGHELRRGATISCGHVRKARLKQQETHGEAKDRRMTPEYRAWCAMHSRCTHESRPDFDRYGGRGNRDGPVASSSIIIAPSLAHLREILEFELHLTCLARSEGDDPKIVECWV
jgi:hypothetical protein